MKRTMIIVWGMIFSCAVSTNTFSADIESTSYVDNNSVVVEESGDWAVDEYVDDFGDGIGVKYLRSVSEGTFSNSATTGSELMAVTFFDPDSEEFSFRLAEYNKSIATYLDHDDIRLLFKFDDAIETHFLMGNAPNGNLDLSVEKESSLAQEYLDNVSSSPEDFDMSAFTMAGLITGNSAEAYSGYNRLYRNLSDDNDARCVIYIGNSKYSFTISAEGFNEAVSIWNEDKYQQAEKLLAEEKYDDAILYFEKINDYKDSIDRIKEAKYGKALKLLEEKNANAALELFHEIKDYSDSADKIEECREILNADAYAEAEDLLEQNKFDEAIKAFTNIEDYKDSKEKISEAKYQKALNMMEQGEYKKARELFKSLGDYLDAVDKLAECDDYIKEADNKQKYQKAEKLLKSGDYDAAVEAFSALGEYEDSETRMKEAQYKKAISLVKTYEFEEAYEIFESLGDYSDAALQAETVSETIKDYEAKYQEATKAMSDKEYDKCYDLLVDLDGYKDSKELFSSVLDIMLKDRYREVISCIREGYTVKAKLLLEDMVKIDYKDSKELVDKLEKADLKIGLYERETDRQVLYDTTDCYVAVTDVFDDYISQGLSIFFYFEDKKSSDMMFQINELTINGVHCDLSAQFVVKSGIRQYSEVRVKREDLKEMNISSINEIHFVISNYLLNLSGKIREDLGALHEDLMYIIPDTEEE